MLHEWILKEHLLGRDNRYFFFFLLGVDEGLKKVFCGSTTTPSLHNKNVRRSECFKAKSEC